MPWISNSINKVRWNYEHGLDPSFIADLKFIGYFNGFQVYFDTSENELRVVDFSVMKFKIQPVITLEIDKFSSKNWHIQYMYLSKKYRKKGLSHKFYHWIIHELDKILISGSKQSPGGSSIWWNLLKYPDIDIKLLGPKKALTPVEKCIRRIKKPVKTIEVIGNPDYNLDDYRQLLIAKKKGAVSDNGSTSVLQAERGGS